MKIKTIFLAACAAASVALVNSSHAAIELNVTGGVGTPLTIEITQGDSFLTTDSHTGTFAVIFENFWDNTENSFTTTFSADTLTMTTSTGPNATGGVIAGLLSSEDLILSFNSTGFSSGQTLTLSTGIRTTSINLSLDYTTINPTGSARVYGTPTEISSGPITWTAVPEPSTYAAIAGVLCLGLAVWRRRQKS